MIAKLRGILDSVGGDWMVIDVGGVGYKVFASARTLAKLPAPGAEVSIHIETHVREDHIHLFGFPEPAELEMFRLLQTVQGVGAKVALGILGVHDVTALTLAIAVGDKAVISQASGVGPKLAARIANELKDKVGGEGLGEISSGPGEEPAAVADAVSALVNLGYRPVQARLAVTKAHSAAGAAAEGADVADLIRRGLRELSH